MKDGTHEFYIITPTEKMSWENVLEFARNKFPQGFILRGRFEHQIVVNSYTRSYSRIEILEVTKDGTIMASNLKEMITWVWMLTDKVGDFYDEIVVTGLKKK